MRLDEPSWWYTAEDQPAPAFLPLLRPIGQMVDWLARQRWRRATPYRSTLPVICVGNFTAGGTGKTPVAIEVAQLLIARDQRPLFLTRGYGGRIKTPRLVDAERDSADRCGDEALLLARVAPTVISPDRSAGARFIEEEAAAGNLDPTVIVMDDGLQNPSLAKDLTIAVVDGRRGFGNGLVMPAGPLRADLDFQLRLTGAAIINRPPGFGGQAAVVDWMKQTFDGPVLEAAPFATGDMASLTQGPIVAYAGIGNPGRYFDLLRDQGAELADCVAFPDHHVVTNAEARRILDSAASRNATIFTTEKDWVRSGRATGAALELHKNSRVLAIRLWFSGADELRLGALLDSALLRPTLNAP